MNTLYHKCTPEVSLTFILILLFYNFNRPLATFLQKYWHKKMSAAFHSHHQHHLEFRDIVKRRSCNISVGLDSPVQILLLAPLCIYSASLRKCSLILGAKQRWEHNTPWGICSNKGRNKCVLSNKKIHWVEW